MKAQRTQELMEAMKSFGKEGYQKDELLNEMLALQKEIVELAYRGEDVPTADLKIWDVERHLEQMNENCGHVADDELKRFMEGSKTLCNLIKAEISGNRGEYKAFKALEYVKSANRILRNVELRDGEDRTELDAVVITPKCVTIVEVKNTAKNIFIDEEGNYFRTGEYSKWDCNIADKMAVKERLLRSVLERSGYGNIQIKSVLVFTNYRIEIQNKYRQLRTSFVSQLAYIIDGYRGNDVLDTDELDVLQRTILDAECKEAYPFELDVNQYKADFANLMETLEIAKAKETNKVMKVGFMPFVRKVFMPERISYAGRTAAAFAVSVVSGIVAANTFGKGGF